MDTVQTCPDTQLRFEFGAIPEPAAAPLSDTAVVGDQDAAAPKKLPASATMQDLLDLVAADPALTEIKRRNLASSIRRFVRYLKLDLHMPAEFPAYRQHLKRFSLAGASISPGRWANIKSDVSFALKRYQAPTRAPLPRDLSPPWRRLRDAMPDERFRRGLSRLMHWASRRGVEPHEVDEETIAAYRLHLEKETFAQRCDAVYRASCKIWNEAADAVPGWPQRRLAVPSFRKTVSLAADTFPASFWADFERYRQLRLGLDLLAEHGFEKPARPSTLKGHREQFRRFASAMVRVGRPASELRELLSLFDRPWFEKAIEAEYERLGGACPSLQESLGTFLAVARSYARLEDERLGEIRRIKQRLRCRQYGMTGKNRERLRQLRGDQALRAFLCLGDRIRKEARQPKSERKRLLSIQTALVHDLLLVAPMRFGNLAALHLQRNLRFAGPGRSGRVLIVLAASQVKNGVDLEFELPPSTAELLRGYLERVRPGLLRGDDDGWLFPGERAGEHKHQVSLSDQLKRTVKRLTGFTINPHLYRHLAATLFLQRKPGEYETVRQLLGHTSLETTMTFYADMEREMASRRYGQEILEYRLQTSGSGRQRRRPNQRSGSVQ